MQRLMLLLLCCLLLLTGCSRDPIAPMASQSPAMVPAPSVDQMRESTNQTILWFRYDSEPLLAPEAREIVFTTAENHALAVLRALMDGPGVASPGLHGLFPAGTHVISATQSGRTIFVTLSRHIMNAYPDEPSDWQNHPVWAIEVPLRRKLAMQAIAATLTENFEADQVVILVDQSATDSLRLRNAYYTLDGDPGLAPPLTREESMLLTPSRTAEVILQCWQASDWERLYHYMAQQDPATGLTKPDLPEFTALMSAQPHLLHACAEGGSISESSAVFTVHGAFLADGQPSEFTAMPLRLTKDKGLWRVGLSQLTGREASP